MSRVSAVLVTSLVLAMGLGAGVAQAAAPPQVTSNSPITGSVAGGTSVTITGSGFTGATAVNFGSTAATSFVVSSDTSVVAVAPAHAVGVVDLSVTGSDGTVGTRTNAFTYFQPPVVTAVSPSTSVTAGGGTVTVTGMGFSGVTGVKFGMVAATSITVQSSTSLTVTAPAGTGSVDVRVTTSTGGTSAPSAGDGFIYIAAPAIASITPNSGPLGGGVTVTIIGARFSGATSVIFGTVAATSFAVVNDSTITAVVPSGAVGTYIVSITTPYGTNLGTPSSDYNIVAAPTVTALVTKTGPAAGGTTVRIGGTGLGTATAVYFGNTLATGLQVISGTVVSAVAPAGSGAVDVTVVTAGGTSPTNATDVYTYVNAPVITSVSTSAGPTAGNTGVTITGSNLTGTTSITFGGVAAFPSTVHVVNDSTVTVLSPAHSVGSVDVQAVTAFGTSVAVPSDVFTYVVKPVVTSSSPNVGLMSGGTVVTIIGTGFTGATAVEFGTTPTTNFVVNSDTSITVISIVGMAMMGLGYDVNVTVDTPGGSAAQVNSATFYFTPAPTVTGVSAASGSAAGGNTVTITGTFLIPVSAVYFGSVAATSFTQGAGTSITAVAPPGTSGTVDVTVTTPGGPSATSAADHYRYISAPVVTGISPASGPAVGGATLTVSGTDLAGASAVRFGSVPATSFVVNSNTSLTVVAPPGTGTADVTVTTTYGTSAISAADAYTYLRLPTITGVNPASGPANGGTTVSITGSGFTPTTVVEFGTTAATNVTFGSSTTLTATSPAGTAGGVDVTVTTAGGTSATVVADRFTYLPGPTITSVSPSSGGVAGGTAVTITGTNFSGATAVDFGSGAAPAFIVLSATTITAQAPASSAGTVDVTVTTVNGMSAPNVSDRFTYFIVPTVSSVDSSSGPVAGGNSVTIRGTGFTGTTGVNFGTGAATGVIVVSDSQLTVTAPAGSSGTVDITVSTPGGRSASGSDDLYTYVAVPTVVSLSPAIGPVAGGTVVTITGTGLTGTTSVTFGGVPAASFTVNSDTSITATAPAGTTGAADVAVSGAGGASLAAIFTYQAAATTPTAVVLGATGMDIPWSSLLVATMLLVLGGTLVVTRRRRRVLN